MGHCSVLPKSVDGSPRRSRKRPAAKAPPGVLATNGSPCSPRNRVGQGTYLSSNPMAAEPPEPVPETDTASRCGPNAGVGVAPGGPWPRGIEAGSGGGEGEGTRVGSGRRRNGQADAQPEGAGPFSPL